MIIKLKNLTLSAALLLYCSTAGQAQQKPTSDAVVQVKVTIVDEHGDILPGATVQVSGKKQGVIADEKGEVSLWVDRNATITVSFVGMKSRSMVISKPLSGKISLQDSTSDLGAVVVTGYTKTTQRRSTGSVATIKAEELQTAPLANTDALLQGKLVGVDVKSVSGKPGESAKIRIRGTNTLTGQADPLWVVDGVAMQRDMPKVTQAQVLNKDFSDIFSNGISGINPSDIASITVLKDASAAAIYGSRAAGGVIVVTTKRGQEGKLRLNYLTNLSIISRPPRSLDLMNSGEKLRWEQELWDEFSAPRKAQGLSYPVIGAVGMIRSGYGPYKDLSEAEQEAAIAKLGEHSTNWFDELFRTSLSHNHYLSLSGGSGRSNYYVSMGFTDNKGLLRGDDYRRYTLSTKLDIKASERIKGGLTVDLSLQNSKAPSPYTDPFSYAYFANPYERPYNDDGSYSADQTYRSIRSIHGELDYTTPSNGFNILRELSETNNKVKNLTAQVIGNITVRLLDGLNFEGLASYGYISNHSDNYNGKTSAAAWLDRPFGDEGTERTYASISQASAYNLNYNVRGQLNYQHSFGEPHHVSTLLGSELRGHYAKSIFAKRYGYDPVSGNSAMPSFPEGTKLDEDKLRSYALIMDRLSGQAISEDAFASFYFSADYSYKAKYIASLTARIDGSSNFGSKEQFNPTGSIGLAWHIDKERFMQALSPTISTLSLRAAMGYTGNINKSVYPQLIIDYRNSFRSTDEDTYRIGFIKNAPNPNLRWEKTRDAKLGVEVGLWDDRLRLSIEGYDRHTYDAVSTIATPYQVGFSSQAYNTSELRNSGLELQVSGKILSTKDWRLSASANIAYNHNELLRYVAPQSGLESGLREGYPLGALFSGKVIGIDPVLGIYGYQTRSDARLETSADRDRKDNYLYYIGLINAPYNGGYNISLSYRNLSLSLGGTFSMGAHVTDDLNYPVTYTSRDAKVVEKIPTVENDLYIHHLNVTRDVTHRWTQDNPITDARPRIIDAFGESLGLTNYSPSSSLITRSSRLQSLSYFKLGSVSLSYNFDSQWVKKHLGVSSLGLSLTANNIFILSSYKGIDPEQPGATYPQPQTYSLGLSLGL